MALSKDEILDAIAEMSVMDIVELVEAMEEKKVEETLQSWGKPLGLPSPVRPSTPTKSGGGADSNKSTRKTSSESKVTPVYMDLAYVPHHGDSQYSDIEFFKRVRARYYVFSGIEPDREVFDALRFDALELMDEAL